MAGIKAISFEELEQMKFTIVEGFAVGRMYRSRSKFYFSIMETVPPTAYGYDCKDYSWYKVQLNSKQDFEQLSHFLNKLFDRNDICIPSGKTGMDAVKKLAQQIRRSSAVVDWGACHVTYMSISSAFQNLNLCESV